MARVNHKKIKRLMNEKKSKITDKQFFTSRALAGHFEDMAAAQSKRYNYNRRVHVRIKWKPKDGDLVSTDDREIRINAGNPIVTKVRGRQNRYQVVCGLFAHELGHVLYTDFLKLQTWQNALAKGRWYPGETEFLSVKDRANEKALWAFVEEDEVNKSLFFKIAHNIANILEDGYIEQRFMNQFPGTLGYGLEVMREREWKRMHTVTQMKEQEEEGGHIMESIMQIMLSYTIYGEIKYGDEELSDERIQAVFGLISEIDSAVMIKDAKNRFLMVNTILVKLWDYIADYLEKLKEQYEELSKSDPSGASGGSASELLEAALKGMVGISERGTGSGSAPVAEEDESEEISAGKTAAGRAKTHKDAEESPDDEDGSENSGDEENEDSDDAETEDGSEDSEDGEEEEDSGTSGEQPEEIDPDAFLINNLGKEGKQKTSEKEKGRIKLKQTTDVSNPAGGSVTRDEDYERECDERAADDIERILDNMAEKAACRQLENERLQELNETAQNISYGNIHEGVSVVVRRISSADDRLKEQYDQIAAPLTAISKQMQKSIIKQLKESRKGGKLTGLMMGRRLDGHALCRNDGKVFYKNSLPNEIPQMAVGLLLDESGSMCSCDRSTYARATAIILYDFCRNLDIPVMVYGHSTGYEHGNDTVELYSYAEFESIDEDDKYRMMDIAARSSNRDGAALRFVAEQLSNRPEEVKILMIVSDGQPAAAGYYGTAAEEDLRGIRQEYKRKNIIFVAAAIGDDKENIERIYGDSFMDITDLNTLPVKLTGVVKRHIRI